VHKSDFCKIKMWFKLNPEITRPPYLLFVCRPEIWKSSPCEIFISHIWIFRFYFKGDFNWFVLSRW